jgi:hypothetical protein
MPIGFLKLICTLAVAISISANAQAQSSANALVYHGRVLKPDGSALQDSAVTFNVKIYARNLAQSKRCLIYEENQTKNLSSSLGAFELNLGESANKVFPTSSVVLSSLMRNSLTNEVTANCAGTVVTNFKVDSYARDRELEVTMTTSAGEVIALPAQNLKATPFAMQAFEIGGYSADYLAKLSPHPSVASKFGLILPQVTTGDLSTWTPTVEGIQVYNITNHEVQYWNGTSWVTAGGGGGGGGGTLSSVGLSLPGELNVTGSPLVANGSISAAWANQNANLIFAGPSTGGAATPGFRALAPADIPNLDWAKITSGKPTTLSGYGITDQVIINAGGTPSFLTDLFANRPAFGTAGRIFIASDTRQIFRDTGTAWDAIGVTTVTSADITNGTIVDLDISATAAIARSKLANGTADHVLINDGSGVMSSEAQLAISRGGTGAGTAAAALNNLLPSQTGNANRFLKTDATNATWAAITAADISAISTTLATNNILIGNGSNVATVSAVGGDLTVTYTSGPDIANFQISGGAVTLTEINSSAYATLPTGDRLVMRDTSGNIAAAAATLDALIVKNVGNTVSITAPVGTTTHNLVLPGNNAAGSLVNNGSGILSWSVPDIASANIVNGTIINEDISATAAIARSKLASGTANHVLINDGTGVMSSEALLNVSRGGTGIDGSTLTNGQILIGHDANNNFSVAEITGTANQINVTNGAGSITLSTPQNIHTAATPQFAGLGLATTNTATTGSIRPLQILPTYNQASGDAANTDLLINRVETAVGSGQQNLIDAQVGGTSRFRVSNAGHVHGVQFHGDGSNLTNVAATAIPMSGLLAATTDAAIDNLNWAQTWNWSTLTTGTGMTMAATGTSITSGGVLTLENSRDNAASVGNVLTLKTTGTSNAAVPMMITNAGTGLSLRVNDDGTATDATPVVVDAAGNVGIGTAAPAAKLDVTATANDEVIQATGYSLTGSNAQSLVDLSGTWNTTGTPALIKANVTDTASNAASLLMDLQVGGTTVFSVSKTGVVTGSFSVANTDIDGNAAPYETSIGFEAGNSVAAGGVYNTFVGFQAGDGITTGDYNVGIGAGALGSATAAQTNNIAIGYSALILNQANDNIAIGSYAHDANTTGYTNITIGKNAMGAGSTSYESIAIGQASLSSITTSALGGGGNHSNLSIGHEAMQYITEGQQNVALGNRALGGEFGTKTTDNSTAIGFGALRNSNPGRYVGNDAFGSNSFYNLSTGGDNAAFGNRAFNTLTTGSYNVGFGKEVGLKLNGDSDGNVLIGYQAGPAGAAAEYDNKLFIDNSETSTPLIYGDFGTNALTVNGTFQVTGTQAIAELESTTVDTPSILRLDANYSGSNVEMSRIEMQGDGVIGAQISMINGTSTAAGNLVFSTRSSGTLTEAMRIDNSSRVGIGMTSGGEKLEVNGNVKATSFISTSDRRLKKNIRSISGIEAILQLNGYEYDWIANNEADGGVIAQEVEKIFPNAVRTDTNGMKAVKYQYLIAPLIEASKDLHQMCKASEDQIARIKANDIRQDRNIASLQEDNAKLKDENEKLRSRLEAIEKHLGIGK